jgi:hypothetical protein
MTAMELLLSYGGTCAMTANVEKQTLYQSTMVILAVMG